MSTTPAHEQPRESTHSARGNTYVLRRFGVREGSLAENPWAVEWYRAVNQGFHDPAPTDEATRRILRSLRESGTRLRTVHTADPVPPAALGAQRGKVVLHVSSRVA